MFDSETQETKKIHDNIILKTNQKTIFQKSLNEFDLFKVPDCNRLRTIFIDVDPNEFCGEMFSMKICVIGGVVGDCFFTSRFILTGSEIDKIIEEGFNFYDNLYGEHQRSLPCSGLYLIFTE